MYQDLVEQVTATTGTGTYAVSGAVAGRRAFSAAYSGGQGNIPYAVVDDAGGYEFGLGLYSADTLERTVVLASSNAGAAVNWAAGDKRIYVTPSASFVVGAPAKNVWKTSIGTPLTTDNATLGFVAGSTWMSPVGSTMKVFFLAQISGTFAVWNELAQIVYPLAANKYLPVGDDVKVYGKGHVDLFKTNSDICTGLTIGGDWNVLGGTYNYADGFSGTTFGGYTTDATPVTMTNQVAFTIYVEGGSTLAFEAMVTATNGAGERKAWKLHGVFSNDGTTTTVDASTATVLFETAGAAAWSVAAIVIAGFEGGLQVTGAAATSIMWGASLYGVVAGRY